MFLLSLYFSTDYFLIDWLYKHGNFSLEHVTSCFNVEGYYDAYNFDAETLKNTENTQLHKLVTMSGGTFHSAQTLDFSEVQMSSFKTVS